MGVAPSERSEFLFPLPPTLDEPTDAVRAMQPQQVGYRAPRPRIDGQILLSRWIIGSEVENAIKGVDRAIEYARSFVVCVAAGERSARLQRMSAARPGDDVAPF